MDNDIIKFVIELTSIENIVNIPRLINFIYQVLECNRSFKTTRS